MEEHKPQTITPLLLAATKDLAAASDTPRLDAELLLAEVLGLSRARLLAEGRAMVSETQLAQFTALLARRADQEPISYILGRREFYGLEFEVTPATLDPRPETEQLVSLAIAWAQQRRSPEKPAIQAADIGTGTGCIAIAFAVNCPFARVVAVDRSPDALAVAARNVQRHHVQDRIRTVAGDLLAPIDMPLDLLLSNPPYTVLSEIDENVFRHEPHLALDGGTDGLDLYRRLLADAPAKLAPGGAIILEIGATQAAAVSTLGAAHFPQASVSVYQDLAGLDRIVMIQT